ncbi:sulfotransferase family protein [Sulfitobacter sabulilitoris]|uniref:Sulfotransferase n=1 Tax=Sulfitobacter sabulilitoris TaxID=2562655 RepID=A0A5S3PD72_9RHOB|nr:sulfotransferase [Sulfitobacter sabulilitoris]TMM49359.1 sulfotransferase [Sulfitobacter sabulilitoris]
MMTQKPAISPEDNAPQKVIFVGGAPRSGTSVTHALLCTAEACNRYHPEISFVRPVLESYSVGLEKWQAHTYCFFKEPHHFKLHVRKLLHQQMAHIAKVLSNPRVLCVKDPLLTPYFPAMREVLGWPSQYVTVLRHPHNVIRSLQEVVERRGGEFGRGLIDFAVHDYMNSYAHLEDPALEGSLLCLRYEDLNEPETIEALRDFTGLPGINPNSIWKNNKGREYTPTPQEQADPWFSPKYHRPIDTQSRLSPLAPHIRDVVNDVCGPIMADYGYGPDGSFD